MIDSSKKFCNFVRKVIFYLNSVYYVRKKESIWKKSLWAMWEQKELIIVAFCLISPFLLLLSYFYESYAPLLFFSLSFCQIKITNYYSYYSLIAFWLLTPAILSMVFSLVTLSVNLYVGKHQITLADQIKKSWYVTTRVVGSLWAWFMITWLFILMVKQFGILFDISLVWQQIVDKIAFFFLYITVVELTRQFSFAVHTYLFGNVSWETALAQSANITKKKKGIYACMIFLLHFCIFLYLV